MNRYDLLKKGLNRKTKIIISVSISLFILAQIIILILPIYYGRILDTVMQVKYVPIFLFMTWGIGKLLNEIISQIASYMNGNILLDIHKNFIFHTFEKIKNIPMSNIIKSDTQYLTNLMIQQTKSISDIFNINYLSSIIDAIKLLTLTVIIFTIDIYIGFITTAFIVVTYFVFKYSNKYYLKKNKEYQEDTLRYHSDLDDVFRGRHEIDNFNSHNTEFRRIGKTHERLRKKANTYQLRNFLHFFWGLDYLRIFYELTVFIIAVYSANRGMYSLGKAVVLISYSTMTTAPVMYLNSLMDHLRNSITSLDIWNQSLGKLKAESTNGIKNISNEIEEIKFDDVSYKADGVVILNHINLTIKKGDHIGITGESGAGKTTLISLMLGIIKPDSGTISINAKNLNDINPKSIYEKTNVAIQSGKLFPISLEENIFLGRKTSKSINYYLDLMKLNEDKKIDKTLSNISGGEKSRILLARALVVDKEITVFDEPLTGIDKDNIEFILKKLREHFAEKTLIVISHNDKLTDGLCDRIYSVENGTLK